MSDATRGESPFAQLAREKLTAVLGAGRAQELLTTILREHDPSLETADDLHAFASALSAYGGFEGAVGGLLSVQAVLHGARRRAPAAE